MNTTQDTTTTETTETESFMDRCARERRETAARCDALAQALAKQMTTNAETWTAKTDEELHYEHFLLIRARDGLELFISGRWSGKNHWHVSLGSLAMPDGTKQSTRDAILIQPLRDAASLRSGHQPAVAPARADDHRRPVPFSGTIDRDESVGGYELPIANGRLT